MPPLTVLFNELEFSQAAEIGAVFVRNEPRLDKTQRGEDE